VFGKIKIEVSVLTKPKELEYKDEDDLTKKIDKKMGIILEKNGRSATYLPQVWEQIEDKEEFMDSLAMKAELGREDLKGTRIKYYRVFKIKE